MEGASIEHHVRGRIRLRLAGAGDPTRLDQLVRSLRGCEQVVEVTPKPSTGSLIVRYEGPRDGLEKTLTELGVARGGAKAGVAETASRPPRARIARLARAAATGRNLATPAVVLTGLGMVQLARGKVLGPASELLWYALRAARGQSPQLALGLALLGILQVSRGSILGSAASLFTYAIVAREAGGSDGDSGE